MVRYSRILTFKLICILLFCSLLINYLTYWRIYLKNGDAISTDFYHRYKILGSNDRILSYDSLIENQIDPNFLGDPKLILVWNNDEFGQQHLKGCPDWNCRVTVDRNLVNVSHAIVFDNHFNEFKEWPTNRYHHQYYVFYTLESPIYSKITQPYLGFYNFTMTYRRDSDAPCPYGYAVERLRPLINGDSEFYFRKILTKKRKLAAWLVSHCNASSGRHQLITELQRYIKIDIYGNCNNASCEKNLECERMIENDYKFYFALENSICKDYLSEKVWHHMTTNLVIIVFKRSFMASYAPKESFLAVDDYPDVRALSDHLQLLDANDELYINYLRWKMRYKAIYLNGIFHDVHERPWGFCQLCRTLWQTSMKTKIYEDIHKWYEDGQCDDGLVNRLMQGS